jgi:N utilization substance protein B
MKKRQEHNDQHDATSIQNTQGLIMSNRRRARELALCAYYALELSGNSLEQTVKDLITERNDVSKDIQDFATSLVRLAHSNTSEIDNYIQNKAINWDFDRIAIIDKLIIRLAICEFLHFADIPPKVSIDEAIEVSKKFSTEQSGKFINGILDSVLIDLRKNEMISKKGRGLLE